MNFKMEYFGIYNQLRIRNQNSFAKGSEDKWKRGALIVQPYRAG